MAEDEQGNGAVAPAAEQGGQTRRGVALPKELRVMVALPAYGRVLYVNCAMSLANLIGIFAGRRVPHRMHSISDAIIARSRNSMAAEFLADDKNWTHLIMIDADVGFNPRDILRMIAFNKPIVGCALPKRQYDTDSLPEGGVKNWEEAEAYMARFTADLDLDDNNKMQSISGFVRAKHIATAVMVIQRETLETMIAKGVVDKIQPDISLAPERAAKFYGFFEPMIDPLTNTYVGEDFAFCRRWREQCGGEIWCDLQGEYTHTGPYDFKGNMLRTIKARGGRIEPNQNRQAAQQNG